MICLLTGATGFIGGHLAERLVREGHQVRGLVRPSSETSLLEQLGVELTVGDLTDGPSLVRATAGCQCVFHCGALVSDWATVDEITRVNVDGTRALLAAAVSATVERFIHLSTTDVYGYPGGWQIEEDHPPSRLRNWYAHTKRAAEEEVHRSCQTQALQAVILRPATVYGPRSEEVVGEIARAICGRRMVLIDGGRAVAGLCYVDNLVDAALLALNRENAAGQAFNITDGLTVTWKEFTNDLAAGLGCPPARWSLPYWMANGIGFTLETGYRALRRVTGLRSEPLLSRQAVNVLGRNQHFSNRKADEVLGWRPRVDYPTGLQNTVDWLLAERRR